MLMKNNKSILNKISSSEPSKWSDDAEYRINNELWLDNSFKIALKILKTLKDIKMTKDELAKKSGIDIKEINKIVKGKENLTLETICKIENALDIDIVVVLLK